MSKQINKSKSSFTLYSWRGSERERGAKRYEQLKLITICNSHKYSVIEKKKQKIVIGSIPTRCKVFFSLLVGRQRAALISGTHHAMSGKWDRQWGKESHTSPLSSA